MVAIAVGIGRLGELLAIGILDPGLDRRPRVLASRIEGTAVSGQRQELPTGDEISSMPLPAEFANVAPTGRDNSLRRCG